MFVCGNEAASVSVWVCATDWLMDWCRLDSCVLPQWAPAGCLNKVWPPAPEIHWFFFFSPLLISGSSELCWVAQALPTVIQAQMTAPVLSPVLAISFVIARTVLKLVCMCVCLCQCALRVCVTVFAFKFAHVSECVHLSHLVYLPVEGKESLFTSCRQQSSLNSSVSPHPLLFHHSWLSLICCNYQTSVKIHFIYLTVDFEFILFSIHGKKCIFGNLLACNSWKCNYVSLQFFT